MNNIKMNIAGKRKKQTGFTLLEMLVAMAILSVIVLSLTTIFNQSNQAWSRGLSKSQKGMEGRAALNMITTELKAAVAAEYLKANHIQNGSAIAFNAILKTASSSNRVIQYVEYRFASGKLIRKAFSYKRDYSGFAGSTDSELASDVTDFSVTVEPPGTYNGTNLPDVVELSIQLKKTSDTAWAEARSAGPNLMLRDDDDITSEEQ